jgi:hypothetical protein
MKIFKFSIIIIVLITCALVSCNKDDESDQNEVALDRDKFLGNWNVNESCSRTVYSVEIVEDPTYSDQVFIKNFANSGAGTSLPALCIVPIENFIKIDGSQKIGDNWTIDGEGIMINDNRIEWEYEIIIPGSPTQKCTAAFSR